MRQEKQFINQSRQTRTASSVKLYMQIVKFKCDRRVQFHALFLQEASSSEKFDLGALSFSN